MTRFAHRGATYFLSTDSVLVCHSTTNFSLSGEAKLLLLIDSEERGVLCVIVFSHVFCLSNGY
jgi:hypothetical protein